MRAARNGIGLIALTLGIIACGDATQPTSPGPAPYEGAKVSMTGTSTISIPGLNGQVVSATTHEWAPDAIVTDGLAQAAQSRTIQDPSASKMPVLYISDKHLLARGPRNNRQILPGKDSKGNGGEFLIITGDAGPVKTMAHVGADALMAYNTCYQTSPCAKVYTCPTCYTSNGFFNVSDPFRPSVVPA